MKRADSREPTVFVVDDDAEMRDSLVMLTRAMGYRARAFDSAAAFHDFYRPDRRGCLILDVKMPGQGGLELYERLVREGKKIPVIFITAHADVTVAVAAMKTGAIEFLEKPFERATLRDRIDKALLLDRRWREREAAFRRIDARIAKLTDRQRETLDLVVAGASNKSMAAKLFISERAVEMRRAGMMRKLGVRSTAELLEMAVTHRVLSEVRRAARFEPFMSDLPRSGP